MASQSEKRNAPTGQGQGAEVSHNNFHVDHVTAEPLLQCLDSVRKSGNGWRARCPACGGISRKVSITEVDDRILLYCFGGCKVEDVLAAIGLTWADIQPPRHWPNCPEDQRRARRALREVGWTSALKVLALESKVALIAARQLAGWQYLSEEDDKRLTEAVDRIDHASRVLAEAASWRPAVRT